MNWSDKKVKKKLTRKVLVLIVFSCFVFSMFRTLGQCCCFLRHASSYLSRVELYRRESKNTNYLILELTGSLSY